MTKEQERMAVALIQVNEMMRQMSLEQQRRCREILCELKAFTVEKDSVAVDTPKLP